MKGHKMHKSSSFVISKQSFGPYIYMDQMNA